MHLLPSHLELFDDSWKGHPDLQIISQVATGILRQAKGIENFAVDVPLMFRQVLDEVIDAPRTGRLTLGEIEKTEKTYIGTKIEILFRRYLKLPKGKKLDLSVDGTEVDIKNTIGRNWSIPTEAYNYPCVLLSCDEKKATCCVGIIIARPEYLNAGENKDGKKTISESGRKNALWLLREFPYPPNFWEHAPAELREKIMTQGSGTKRLAELFRSFQQRPISRTVIEGVGQQKDSMKRLRKNGGARDQLAKDEIALLWGRKDKQLIEALGLPACSNEEFISVRPTLPAHRQLLAKHFSIAKKAEVAA